MAKYSLDPSLIDALKAKIQASLLSDSQSDGHIALTNFTPGQAKYVFTHINIDWDPADHPRDPNTGEFAKSPSGYIFGHAKSATFGIGGKAKKLDLAPGDVAFKTPGGNVVVSHADGSYSLHQPDGGVATIPQGNEHQIAADVQSGKYQQIGSNPGTLVPASTKKEAQDMVENPSYFASKSAKPVESSPAPATPTEAAHAGQKSAWEVPKPTLKPGKKTFTAKQYADYQKATKGLPLGPDKDGTPINSGDWIELDGKPVQIWVSPYGKATGSDSDFNLTAYRWVSTKQQASNLEKEGLVTLGDFSNAKRIEDPTGKPYGIVDTTPAQSAAEIKHGSIMTKAVIGSVPNSATAHKKHVADQAGLTIAGAFDKSGAPVVSGDWVELEGKPFQVHSSPNEGNVALAKWVSTKKQASNNTYDFPASVLSDAVLIDNPVGKDYKPTFTGKTAETPEPTASDSVTADTIAAAPVGTKAVLTYPQGLQTTWTKTGDGQWKGGSSGVTVHNISVEGALQTATTESGFLFSWMEPDKDPIVLGHDGPVSLEGNQILSPPTPKVDTSKPHPLIDFSEDNLKSMESGTVVHSEAGIYLKGEGDSWQVLKGGGPGAVVNGVDTWPTMTSAEAVAIMDALDTSTLNWEVVPWDTPENDALLSDPSLFPIEKSVTLNAKTFEFKKGAWHDEYNVPYTGNVADILDEKYAADQKIGAEILAMSPGDELHLTKKSNGKVSVYQAQEDGTLQSLQFPDGPTTVKDHYVKVAASGIGEKFDWEVKAKGESTEDLPAKGQQFVHPVSGVVLPMQAGDKVYQHKSTSDGYIVVKAKGDKPVIFFNQFGKQYLPKEKQKNLDTSYKEIEDWPGKVDLKDPEPITPGTAATVEMLHNASEGDAVYVYSEIGNSSYTKNANGGWIGGDFGAEYPEALIETIVSDPGYGDSQFWPKGSKPADGHASAYPEAVNEPQVDPKPKSTKVTKKTAKPALPKTVTMPDGTTIDLKPGEAFALTKDEYGSEYYVHVTQGPKEYNNYNKVYNVAGTPAYWAKAQSWTPNSLKSWVKKNGGEVLGENAVSIEKTDFSDYGTDALESQTASAVSHYITIKKNAFPIGVNYYGGLAPYQGYPQYEDKTWNTLDLQQRLELISSYENDSGKAVATLETLKSADWLDANEKKAFGKVRSGFELIHRIAVIARELGNSESEWDDSRFESEIALVASKVAKPGLSLSGSLKGNYPIADLYNVLQQANKQRAFKSTLSNLDFDPLNGTTEEYDAYAKSKGFPILAALSPEHQKQWVLIDLGDPTVSNAVKAQVAQAAEQAKSQVAIATLSASLTKGQTISTTPAVPIVKGIHAKQALKNSYVWTDDKGIEHTVSNVGYDEWKWTADGHSLTVNDAMVSKMVNDLLEKGQTFSNVSKFSAYGSDSAALAIQKLEQKHNINWGTATQDTLAGVVFSQGGHSVLGSASAETLKIWLLHDAHGDQIAKYNVEKNYFPGGVHEDANSHPGSPTSPQGAAAHKALAALLGTSAAGQKWLDSGWSGVSGSTSDQSELGALLGLTGDALTGSTLDNFSTWDDWHNFSQIKESHSVPSVSATGKAVQPPGVSDEAWALVSHVDATTDLSGLFPKETGIGSMTDDALTAALATDTSAKQAGLISPLLGALPTHVKRLALWGAGGTNDPQRKSILLSIAARAKAGEYLEDHTPVWVSPTGAKYPISPGATVYKIEQDHYTNGKYYDAYVVTGPPKADGSLSDSGWKFVSGGTATAPTQVHLSTLKSLQAGSTGSKVFTMPGAIKFDQASKDVPDLTKPIWDESVLIEEGKSKNYTYHESGAILTAALKKNLTLEQNYPNLYAQHKILPEQVRQAVAAALGNGPGSEKLLDLLDYKASKGHYASLTTKGLFDANQPWIGHLSQGKTSEDDVLNTWSSEAKEGYATFYGIPQGNIASHLDSLLNPPTSIVTKALPKFEDLQLTETGKSLGGMHSKKVWVDQDGNEWMSKAFNSDPNAKARVDAETGAVRIGHLYGFRTPAANTQAVPGQKYAYLQHLAPATGDLSGKGPGDLSLKQLQQAMEEHLLDWIVSNHDTHSQNLMTAPDGSVFGIDKGQAFKFFPNDKLAVGYLPPGNGAAVWYDQFYNSLISGKIDKATADEVTKHVLRRAQKVSKDKDAEYRAELETALKNRDFWPAEYPTREKFIDALVERKHNAFEDFVALYKSMYDKSPLTWDIDTENLVPPKLDDHTHIAASQDYADDVQKSGVHGKTIFFHSAHLEDSHIITSVGKTKDGSAVLLGEAKIRKDGDKVLSEWLSKQTIDNHVGYQQQSYYNDYDSTPVDQIDGTSLPNNAEYFNAMVQGSKTVSSHNASGDHAYNQGTLNTMDSAASQVQVALDSLAVWEKNNPGEPFKGTIPPSSGQFGSYNVDLHTMEQHDAWKQMLETYKQYGEKVNDHKGSDAKISPHFTQIAYTPSAAAVEAINAKKSEGKTMSPFKAPQVKEILEKAKNGDTITYTDGNTTVTLTKQYGGWNSSTTGSNVSSEGVENLAKNMGDNDSWSYSGFVPEFKDDEESATVQVGTKILKVTKRPSAMQNGTFDPATGDLTLSGKETDKFQTGHMYEIDFGDTVVEYRPWDTQVALAQQGLLRFRKTNWTGDPESMEEIFDVLRQMGLALDPASETSMELFYWKHLYGILSNRKDGKTAKWMKVHNRISTDLKEGMTPEQELSVFRAAWAEALGADVVSNADWMPKFSRQRIFSLSQDDPEFTTGHPYWHRPDYGISDIRKWVKNLPSTSLTYAGSADDALPIALSGSMLSTEERSRYYGSLAKGGASSGDDQTKGSSAQVYTRQNSTGNEVIYHPRVLLRTHNYAYDGDFYGKIAAQIDNASFDPQDSMKISGGELMIKHAVSVLDDIIMLRFPNEHLRQQAIDAYKKRGVTTLHGLPIEDIFVVYADNAHLKKVMDHVYEATIKDEKGTMSNAA